MPSGKSGLKSFLFGSGLGLGLGLLLAPESGEKTREKLRGIGQGVVDLVDAGLTVLTPVTAGVQEKAAAESRSVVEVGRELGSASRDVLSLTGEELAAVLDTVRRFVSAQLEAGLAAISSAVTAAREARESFTAEWERRNAE